MGCTPGTTPEYLSLLRMHKMQKPSVSQGLYPILLLALLASTTSAYTSLGVSQDSNPQPQLLKATVYHSVTVGGGLVETALWPLSFLLEVLGGRVSPM
jgi:hypothetical protein